MPFGVGHRTLEPAERLGRHRHREEALDVDLHDLGLELFEQLLAAAVVDPAEAFVGVEAEHRTGAEQRGGLVLAVPVHSHRVGHVDLAAVDAVEHLERMDDRAAMQQVDLEPAARHVVHAGDVLLAHLGEDVGGGPRRLQLQRRRLRARNLRHRDCGSAGCPGREQEFATRCFFGCG